MNSRVHRER
uniref:Uncharacterized protein n=1 Tax=Anguilla anguilla TaxID=7936 RepID=A0A0E9XRY4_ANGAN